MIPITDMKWRFMPSPTEIICLLVGAFFVFWYAWIIDDAYVYFRYVDNLVIHGHGLVWNPGEYVEGFSSPVWTLLLSGLRLLHLDYWMIVRGVGLLCFFVFWWLACLVNRGLTATGNSQSTALNFPLIYLCFTYAVSCYFTSGLESPLVNVVAVAYAAALLWPRNSVLQGIVGLSPLVRPELLIPYLLFLAYSFFVKKCKPYVALLLFVLSIGGYGIFRVWYYADLLPNTFYLKDTTWFVQGLCYVYDTIVPYQAVPFLLCMFLAYTALVKARYEVLCSRERLAMLLLALPVAAYVVKIGGDPRHFRYLAFPFVLVVLASGGLAEDFITRFTYFGKRYAILFAAVFGIAVASQYPRQLLQHPLFLSHFGYAHKIFLKIEDAAYFRVHPTGVTPSWRSLGHFLTYAEAEKRYATEATTKAITDFSPLGRSIWCSWEGSGEKPSTVPIIADSWCQCAYLHAALPTIHNLGLTEPFLARTRMPSDHRSAHKRGLRPLAEDLLRIRSQYGFARGAFDLAISGDTKTPEWIVHNIHALRIIERKVYNDHNFFENMKLAFLPVGQIDPKLQGNVEQHTAPYLETAPQVPSR